MECDHVGDTTYTYYIILAATATAEAGTAVAKAGGMFGYLTSACRTV